MVLTQFKHSTVEDFHEKILSYQSDRLVVGNHDPSELVSVEEIERRYILHVLKMVKGNRTLACAYSETGLQNPAPKITAIQDRIDLMKMPAFCM